MALAAFLNKPSASFALPSDPPEDRLTTSPAGVYNDNFWALMPNYETACWTSEAPCSELSYATRRPPPILAGTAWQELLLNVAVLKLTSVGHVPIGRRMLLKVGNFFFFEKYFTPDHIERRLLWDYVILAVIFVIISIVYTRASGKKIITRICNNNPNFRHPLLHRCFHYWHLYRREIKIEIIWPAIAMLWYHWS